jgi:serine/threonine protein kinase
LAEFGDICRCLKNAYSCSEDVTRTLVKQLLEAITYSLSKNYMHEPLKSYDLLLDQNHQIKLSGWGTAETANKEGLRKLVFSIGEIIVLLLTGNPAFNKHNQNDVLFKFISPKSIGKFWEALSKRVKGPIPK